MRNQNQERVAHNNITFAEPVRSVAEDKKHRDAALDFLLQGQFSAFPITINFKQRLNMPNGTWQTLDVAEMTAATSLLLRRIAEHFVGKHATRWGRRDDRGKRGFRLQGQYVWEYGSERGYHVHGRIERLNNVSFDTLGFLLMKYSRKMRWIERVHLDRDDREAWQHYILKQKETGSLLDHIDLTNTWWI